jgi:RNA polymerase sigma-70 factor (ECF subfamily)
MGQIRSDEELVRGFKEGDLDAFTELVRRHHRSLVNFFYRQQWDRHKAEDLAQEVFLRLYKALPSYEPTARFTTYLYRMARNLWIDTVRAASVRPKVVSLERPLSATSDTEAGELMPVVAPEPGDAVSQIEAVEEVRRAVMALPDEYRVVVLLAEFHQMRYEEIAVVLDIPVGTVKSRMHHAIGKLKELVR